MYCPNCGGKIDDDATFCENCGTKIEQTSVIESIEHLVAEEQGSGEIQPIPAKEKSLIDLIKGVNPKVWVGVGVGLIVILIIVISILASGNDNDKTTDYEDFNDSNYYESDYSTESSEPEIVYDEYSFKPLEKFSNGIMKVSYQIGGAEYIGYSDENGLILRSYRNLKENGPVLSNFESDGFAVVDENGHIEIVNKKGEVTYTMDSKEEDILKIIAHKNNIFIVFEHVKNFSENVYYAYSIDSTGKLIDSKHKLELNRDLLTIQAEHISNDIFRLFNKNSFNDFNTCIYNPKKNSIFSFDSNIITYTLDISKDYPGFFLLKPSYYGSGYVKSPISILDSKEAFEQYVKNNNGDDGLSWDSKMFDEDVGVIYKDGKPNYYDYDGKIATEIPKFSDNINIKKYGFFSDGYAPLILVGADKREYFTIFDKNGKTKYEPIILPKRGSIIEYNIYEKGNFRDDMWRYICDLLYAKGYLIYREEDSDTVKIIYPEGQVKTTEYNFVDINGFDGDYIYFQDSIVSIKDFNKIDVVKIPQQ